MSKKGLFLLLAFLALIFGVLVVVSQNTKVLNEPDVQEIVENNAPPEPKEIKNEILEELEEKQLIVPEKFQTGQLAEPQSLQLPKSLQIKVRAGDMKRPRGIAVDENDNVYLTDLEGFVYVVPDGSDDKILLDKNLRSPHGILIHEGDLYVAEEDKVVAYRGIQPDGTFSQKQPVITNLPKGDIFSAGGGHKTRTIRIGPDNRIYVSVGSSCNVCEEDDPRRAAIVSYNMDGTGEQVFALGLRNTVGFIFDQNNKIWGVDNGRDLIGDDLPPEEVNIISVDNHYGWPYCYGKGIANPEYPERQEFCEETTEFPLYEMQAHSAPLGLAFAPWDGLEHELFITYHGSWNRTTPTGYKLVRIDTRRDDNGPVNFITGWLNENGSSWGRPVDVFFTNRGTMLITDDKAGVLYEVFALDEE